MSGPGPAVLFDLDGTLADSRTGIVTAINATLRGLGEPERPGDELASAIGPPLHETFGALLPAADDAALDAAVADYRRRYAVGMVAGSRLYDGVVEVLDALVDGGRVLAVATSKARPLAEPLLEGLGIADRFAVVRGPVPPARDSKTETIAQALAALGVDGASGAVMVGDRWHDIDGGRAHGLRTIGVTWGFGSVSELTDAGADALASDTAELGRLLGL